MQRTISAMVGKGSVNHNSRKFRAENVDGTRTHLNIDYCNENIKTVYHELFDEALERYNAKQIRSDRKIKDYYEKIRSSKQEKPFHEIILQVGGKGNMNADTENGELAKQILDEYYQGFQERNPQLRVFSAHLHMDEATPHLHIDFVPYVTGWKGKGMDTRVSLKQALKRQGFQGGTKHATELNQWINHEKEILAEIAKQHGIEWKQKGTQEEHLDVYNFKKKERKKEVQELEQEKEYLTAENEGLTLQIADARADIKNLREDKEQAIQEKELAEKYAEETQKELENLAEQRAQLQPIIDKVSKELKECRKLIPELPEAGALERASTYRDKKITPLFNQMKGIIAGLAAQVQELNTEIEKWKEKYKREKQICEAVKKDLSKAQQRNQYLQEEKEELLDISEQYSREYGFLEIKLSRKPYRKTFREKWKSKKKTERSSHQGKVF